VAATSPPPHNSAVNEFTTTCVSGVVSNLTEKLEKRLKDILEGWIFVNNSLFFF
jgi:hypothetical protein